MTVFEPRRIQLLRKRKEKTPRPKAYVFFLGELISINSEHLFEDLFKLKERFEALGMIVKDDKVHLSDIEDMTRRRQGLRGVDHLPPSL